MFDIKIHKYNHTHFYIEADKGVLYEINDAFAVMSKNPWFNPAFKRKQWDGKHRIFKVLEQLMPIGLYPKFVEWARKHEYKLARGWEANEDGPIIIRNSEAARAAINDYIDKLNVSDSEGNSISFRPHQREGVLEILTKSRRLIVSPTNSGKSLIIYCVLRYYLDHAIISKPEQMLLLVPNKGLVEQMFSDFKEYSQLNGWNVAENVYRLYGYKGADKEADFPIIVSTWQSLQDEEDSYFHRYTKFICDEVHLADGKEIKRIVEACINASCKAGMSGTLKDLELHIMVLTGLFGPEITIITSKEMQELGYSAKTTIHVVVIDHSEEDRKNFHAEMTAKKKENKEKNKKDSSYPDELEFILKHQRRNLLISKFIDNREGNCLVMFERVEDQGIPLYEQYKLIGTKISHLVYGAVSAKKREAIRQEINNPDSPPSTTFGSYGTLSTGSNIKRIHHLILAFANESMVQVLQTLGRGLRKGIGKDVLEYWDFVDDLSYKGPRGGKYTNHKLKHGLARIKHYTDEGYNIIYHKIKL